MRPSDLTLSIGSCNAPRAPACSGVTDAVAAVKLETNLWLSLATQERPC